MRYVFGARQPWAAALAVIITLVVAGFVTTGNASATTTTGSQGHATCDDTTGGGCAFSGNGSATFSGYFDHPEPVILKESCGPQVADSIDLICGHYSIEPSINGIVTSSIAFNPDNDLDLCAYNAANEILACSEGQGATEQVTFAVSGGSHYEVRILPIMYAGAGPDMFNPVTYTGAVSFTSGGGGETVGLSTPGACCHKVDGGGKTATLTTPDANFEVHVDDDTGQNGTTTAKQLKGKVRVATATCDFRSTSIDTVTWDDMNRQATINGHGRYKDTAMDVTFTATATDNGDKNSFIPDTFTIDKCTSGSTVVHGEVKYKVDNH